MPADPNFSSDTAGALDPVRVARRLVLTPPDEDVKSRLGELSTDCRQFLKVAAVLGRSFTLEDASRLLDRPLASLLVPLDEALAAGFVVATEHRLAFQSEPLWRGAFDSIPAPARDALHREAMDHAGRHAPAYERQPGVRGLPAAPSDELDVEVGGAYSKAHILIMSGKATLGIRVAERVLADPSISASARLDAEASMILGYFLLGMEDAEKHAKSVLRERRPGRGDVAALMALTTLSNVSWRAGELAEGLRLGRTAVKYGDSVDPVWRLHFQLSLAGKLANLREFDKAAALINEVEAGLHGLSARVWTAAPATMRSRLLLQAGRFADARRQAELATAAVGLDAVPVLRPLALSVLATVSLRQGDLPSATSHSNLLQSELAREAVLCSAQYAWTEVRIAAEQEGHPAAVELLTGEYRHLPAQRSLYVEEPGAAAFLIRLARDVGDIDLERTVLETVNGLAEDNPGVLVVSLGARLAEALANGDVTALERMVTLSPDPFSVALATEELGRLHGAKAPAGMRQTTSVDSPSRPSFGKPHAGCTLSDMERQIGYLVSIGLTNRQIAKRVHLSAHTVNYHLRKIYKKLGISTRAELAREAVTHSHDDDERHGHGKAGGTHHHPGR